jgi:hypothetical protein
MEGKQVFGIMLVAIGLGLIVWGSGSMHSLPDKEQGELSTILEEFDADSGNDSD